MIVSLLLFVTLNTNNNVRIDRVPVKAFNTENECNMYLDGEEFSSIYDSYADMIDSESVDYKCEVKR